MKRIAQGRDIFRSSSFVSLKDDNNCGISFVGVKKMVYTLTKNKKYIGKYVALKDFGEASVVGYGNTPQEAYQKALRKGLKCPVITYIPEKELVQIYWRRESLKQLTPVTVRRQRMPTLLVWKSATLGSMMCLLILCRICMCRYWVPRIF